MTTYRRTKTTRRSTSSSNELALAIPSQIAHPNWDLPSPTRENVFHGPTGSSGSHILKHEFICTNVFNLLEFQGWWRFLETKLDIYPDLALWFYRHVKFTNPIMSRAPPRALVVRGNRQFFYGLSEFEEDFGLGDDRVNGPWLRDGNFVHLRFDDYGLTAWPRELVSDGIEDYAMLCGHLFEQYGAFWSEHPEYFKVRYAQISLG